MYPNVYGAGTSFAFSGLDGVTQHTPDFVGTLTADGLGIRFEIRARRTLSFELAPGVRDITYALVSNDAWDIEPMRGKERGCLRVAMVEHKALAGKARYVKPHVTTEPGCEHTRGEGCSVQTGPGGATALVIEENGDGCVFAFAFDPEGTDAALDRARAALRVDVDAVIAQRKAFFDRLPPCPSEDEGVMRAYMRGFSILKHNVHSGQGRINGLWTTPDRLPHKHMWLWDSVFHSFGLCYIGEDLAARAIEAVLEQQLEDGFIPHMMTPENHSEITQPPLLAWGIWRCFERTGDTALLERTHERLRRYLSWNSANRDGNGNGLCEWFIEGDPRSRSGESGMDNSPRFDEAASMDAIDFSCFMKNDYDCLAKIEDALGLEAEAAASRAQAERIARAINELLWSQEDGMYVDRHMDGRLSRTLSVSGFLPLWAGAATPERAEALRRHVRRADTFATPLPIPSVSASDPAFGTDMWRGAVWMNYTYMIIQGLARYGMREEAAEIAQASVASMTRWYLACGTLYEFYDAYDKKTPQSLDRKGPYSPPVDIRRKIFTIADYGWTAAVFVALLREGYLGD